MKVLVVEDEPDLLRSLAQALREEGYAVDVAADGNDGLFKAESWDYDAIVLDIMLPRLDGWQVLERLRKTIRSELKQVPVNRASHNAQHHESHDDEADLG